MVEILFILLIVIGFCSLFPRSIQISSKLELRRPRTIIFGLLVLAGGLMGRWFLMPVLLKDQLNPWWILLPILIPIIGAVILKQPKASELTPQKKSFDFVNVITWVILLVFLMGGGILLLNVLSQK